MRFLLAVALLAPAAARAGQQAPLLPSHFASTLAREAQHAILEDLPARLPADLGLRVSVHDPKVSAVTADPYHPATYAAGPLWSRRPPFDDGTYRARLDLEVQLVDAAGIVKASRSFTGRAAKTVRFPSPHPYRSFDSIHAIGRKHAGCAAYPEPDYLLRHALHDAVAGHSGAASWVRGQMR